MSSREATLPAGNHLIEVRVWNEAGAAGLLMSVTDADKKELLFTDENWTTNESA
jgi:hypothetical protein